MTNEPSWCFTITTLLIDDDVTTAGEYTDDDIVQNCVKTCTDGNDSEDETDQFHNVEREQEKIPKKQDALNALETLHRFFEYAAIIDQTIFDKIYELEKHTQNVETETPLKLTDFFH
ncbi:hypothetical protein WA026_023328 [Henosepilachna vigintioctopunctata]|uniref:Uncharacterized protein n=1 Tax=Henosepilachna vigintioctopunctata TaxID=420089 RepID=A0AAW1UQY7_9CUCU